MEPHQLRLLIGGHFLQLQETAASAFVNPCFPMQGRGGLGSCSRGGNKAWIIAPPTRPPLLWPVSIGVSSDAVFAIGDPRPFVTGSAVSYACGKGCGLHERTKPSAKSVHLCSDAKHDQIFLSIWCVR